MFCIVWSNEVVILEFFELARHLHVQEEHFEGAVYLAYGLGSFWSLQTFTGHAACAKLLQQFAFRLRFLNNQRTGKVSSAEQIIDGFGHFEFKETLRPNDYLQEDLRGRHHLPCDHPRFVNLSQCSRIRDQQSRLELSPAFSLALCTMKLSRLAPTFE